MSRIQHFSENMAKPWGKLYVSGLPRGATKYTSEVLRSSGFDVGHEREGAHGQVGWNVLLQKEHPTYHQTRAPLGNISSLTQIGSRIFGMMEPLIGEFPPEDNKLAWAARAWVLWNRRGIENAKGYYRVEDLGQDTFKGFKLKASSLEKTSKKTNTRPHQQFTWEDLKMVGWADEVRQLAEELGYATS